MSNLRNNKMSKPQKFSERLRSFRERNGLSQEEMAEKLGLSRNYVSMMEGGREPSESVTKLFEIMDSSPMYRAWDLSGQPGLIVAETKSATTPRERLKAALEAKGLKVGQLAKLTKYSAGALDAVVNGTARISEDMARAIVREVPELELEELLDGSDSPRVMEASGLRGTAGATPPFSLPGKNKTRYVPLIQWAAASSLARGKMPAMPDDDYEHEGVASSVPGKAFAVEVRGDSMTPKIEPGDFVVVRADVSPAEGEIVLVRTFDGDVLCKRYATRDGGRMVILSSINPSHAPREISAENIAWIYPVKQLIRNNVSGL